ncbi:(2Fe-2S)-binding protein [Clostridium chrysemydis]|uniref:(2Fe-2S)-binding protein n=1 Tax=Clostridium chrysemydis TaxID=2665504 RepID=UPI00188402E3|nr:2Fe-2S iron-sulfur cluster-binding protein [Clostridium chrysemydis]
MMTKIWINNKLYKEDIPCDKVLLDYIRDKGYLSVKRGCDTSNCGLCTVWADDKPILSCSTLAVRMDGKQIFTLEGLKEKVEVFAKFMAKEGADQCGFCNPGFIMNVLAMEKELVNPSEEEIREYLSGNLCRCTGYMGQIRAIEKYLARKED